MHRAASLRPKNIPPPLPCNVGAFLNLKIYLDQYCDYREHYHYIIIIYNFFAKNFLDEGSLT